jgi:hypothetical protein
MTTQTLPLISKSKVEYHVYNNEMGNPACRVERDESKNFRQSRWDDKVGRYIPGLDGFKPPLYNLPAVIKGIEAGNTIFIVEGEKDADRLAGLGLIATTNAGGAGKWREEFADHFLCGKAVIIPDNDLPGQRHAQDVANNLYRVADCIKIVELSGLEEKGDVSDWLDDGHTKENLLEEVAKAPLYNPDARGEINQLDDWPTPETITGNSCSHVVPLPDNLIPKPYAPWIKDVALRMQCPPEYVAVAAITLTGSLIGTRCAIRPKQLDDWTVIPNLWGGVVGDPSMLKSPSIKAGLKPLEKLEIEAKERSDSAANDYEAELAVYQAKKNALKKGMGKAADGVKEIRPLDEIRAELASLGEPEKPTQKRYKTNDATIEKLGELLRENPQGLLLYRDELVGMLASWDKPGREADRAFYLESWDGDASHTSDRIGRGSIFTENHCISIFGGIQPSKLTDYLSKAMYGLDNDGFIQRLQMLVYAEPVKDWKYVDKKPDREAIGLACKIIEALAKVDFSTMGAAIEEGVRFPYMRFEDEAQKFFNQWLTHLVTVKLRADDHPMLLEHLGKYRSLMPALALIFHLINAVDEESAEPVSLQAANMAAAWCDYLESHARKIYGLVGDMGQQTGEALAEKIVAGKVKEGFTVRSIYRNGWTLLNSAELAHAACDELVEAGWLKEERKSPAFQQREKRIYRINPKVRITDKP